MKELIYFFSQFPPFILVLAILIEISLIYLFFQFLIDENKTQKKRVSGGHVAQFNSEEYKAVFKVIEKRLNELASRCDVHEKKIVQLESQAFGKEGSSPAGLEHKVNELQKLVFTIVEKIKEYQ